VRLEEEGGDYRLTPMVEVGTAAPHDPEMARLSEIVRQMNDLFAGDLTDADLLTYARHITGKLLENEALAQQAASNSQEGFALGDFPRVFIDTVIDALDSYQSMAEQVLSREETRQGFERMVLELVYRGFAQMRTGESIGPTS